MRTFVLAVAVLASGCESGNARVVNVTVPATVAAPFTEAARGVVVVDVDGQQFASVVLCGQQLPSPLVVSQDLGFGCIGSREGTTESVGAWVQPMPMGWAELPCSASRQFYRPSLPAADGGTVLARMPQAMWAQGAVEAAWRRDGSPCGGILKTSVTLATP